MTPQNHTIFENRGIDENRKIEFSNFSLFGFILYYNVTTLRWFGAGQRVNNAVRSMHEADRAAREGKI